MKTKEIIVQIISILLIILFFYTALSKLMDIPLFRAQLSRQAIVGDYADVLIWVLPLIEIIAALLLMFKPSRRAGILLSFTLMSIFTIYVGIAVMGYWENIPCSCGGVLNQLGWKDHLWFNLFFLGISGAGLYLTRNIQHRGALKQSATMGGPA